MIKLVGIFHDLLFYLSGDWMTIIIHMNWTGCVKEIELPKPHTACSWQAWGCHKTMWTHQPLSSSGFRSWSNSAKAPISEFFEKLTGRLQTKAEQREASHLAILAMLVQFPKLIWSQFGGDFPYKPWFMVSFSSLSKVAWIYHPNEHDEAVMSRGPRGRLRSLRFGITLHFKVHPVAHLQVLSSESPPAMCQRKSPKNHLQKLRFEPPETWKLQEYSIHHLQKLSFEPAKT